ncbi:MAG: GNAT family N-acetyltransferase [Xanthomonadales bacterium]|nr:GNAT family N-acetyltransferase [Xanthomonadales bacterium]
MSEINIRHAGPDDAAAVHAIYAETEGYRNTLQLPYPPAALWEQRLQQPAPGVYSLVAESAGEVVGQLSLIVNQRPRRRHCAELGMGVAARARRDGVGTRLLSAALELCDQWLQVSRVEITVYVDNPAGIALYRKLGFVEEGRARAYAFRDGQYCDVLMMARIRPTA